MKVIIVGGGIGGLATALMLHERFSGERLLKDRPAEETVIRSDAIRMHHFALHRPHVQPERPVDQRDTFDEVHEGLPDLEEAKRCLSCGVCNACDRCVTFCPDGVLGVQYCLWPDDHVEMPWDDPLAETTVPVQWQFVVRGDATDADFWARAERSGRVKLALLAFSDHEENMAVASILQELGFELELASVAHYPDHEQELRDAGVKAVFNFYAGAGENFAEHVVETFSTLIDTAPVPRSRAPAADRRRRGDGRAGQHLDHPPQQA